MQTTYWTEDNSGWVCLKHLTRVVMQSSEGVCSFKNCTSVRPRQQTNILRNASISTTTSTPKPEANSTESSEKKVRTKKNIEKQSTPTSTVKSTIKEVVQPEAPSTESTVEMCAWHKCTKNDGKPAPSRPKSRYCSRDCSNKQARFNFRQRKSEGDAE